MGFNLNRFDLGKVGCIFCDAAPCIDNSRRAPGTAISTSSFGSREEGRRGGEVCPEIEQKDDKEHCYSTWMHCQGKGMNYYCSF